MNYGGDADAEMFISVSWFNKHFIKTGILDKKHGKLYSELFDKRQEGDYQAFVNFDESEILPLIEEVKTFYSELNRIILK